MKILRINRSANRLLIISTNLDGFGLANHGQFAKFTNVSPRQSFPPYGNTQLHTSKVSRSDPDYYPGQQVIWVGNADSFSILVQAYACNKPLMYT